MTEEQWAVVERYREQEAAIDRYRAKSKSNLSIVMDSGEHWNWLISAQLRNVMIQSGDIKACSEKAPHFSLNYQRRTFN